MAKNKENVEKKEQPRIVIDCTREEHMKVKTYCAGKGEKMKSFCLAAVMEKMQREP